MSSRFDYVKYDEHSVKVQEMCKKACTELEIIILQIGFMGRSHHRALAKLEECYMWIGKAIRDNQIQRNGSAELQEERKNG